MKKNNLLTFGLIFVFLLIIGYQNYSLNNKIKKQELLYQTLLLEKEQKDTLADYFENIYKAQYYFLQNKDSLSFEFLKPYQTLPDSIRKQFQRTREPKISSPIVTSYSKKKESVENTIEKNNTENGLDKISIIQEELALVKAELKQLKTPKPLLDLISTKGVKFQYFGQTKNGKADGFGIGLFESGSIYKGFWKENIRHGDGVFTWKDGEHYEGKYVNDKRQGEGSYFWKNGEIFKGQWSEDKRNGQGKLFKKNGSLKKEGIWIDDQFKS